MAAIDTFEWLIKKSFPEPDEPTRKWVEDEREYLLSIRNENDRLRYLEELQRSIRESAKAQTKI